MTTTIGMWEMISELLEGEKLPVSMNETLEGLCNGDLVIAERHDFRKLEAENHALKAQVELLRKAQEK
jgi:cell division protein FtsB